MEGFSRKYDMVSRAMTPQGRVMSVLALKQVKRSNMLKRAYAKENNGIPNSGWFEKQVKQSPLCERAEVETPAGHRLGS